ncbi:unnamed protein product [Prunus armeniaca]
MDFWLKDGIAPVSLTLSLSPARRSLSPLVRDSHRGRPRFGRPFARPATKVDGAGTKMTGLPSSSYPGQEPPPAAVVSPENEEKSSGFDRKFAGFVLRRPAAIFGDQESRTDIAYRVFSGFAGFGPLDGPDIIIYRSRYYQDRVGFDGS